MSLAGPQRFVVFADGVFVASGNRFPIERNESVFWIAAKNLLSNTALQFGERLGKFKFDFVPVGYW